MEIFNVRITARAFGDIWDITRHIAYVLGNPQAASKTSSLIISSAEALSIFPKRHRVRKQDSRGRKLRFFPIGSYVVVYHVNESKHTVEVLRITYSRRDMNNLI